MDGSSTSVIMGQIGLGLTLGLATIGSALGISTVSRSAAGAWAKEAKARKSLSFVYIILMGIPLSETIYAFVLMFIALQPEIVGGDAAVLTESIKNHGFTFFGIGIAAGLVWLFSGWMKGRAGAAGVRFISENEGKGLVNSIIAMGICETVGLFGFVFLLLVAPSI